jgi:F-type H+-transporting ATPase subunit alpha
MKSVVGSLKIDLAQFRDLEAFATFGSELDRASQAQLDRGYRLIELLKQGQNEPMPVEEQVVVIYAGVHGFTDAVAVGDLRRFESVLRADLRSAHADLLSHIARTGELPDVAELNAAISEVAGAFAEGTADDAVGGEPVAGPARPSSGDAEPVEPRD